MHVSGGHVNPAVTFGALIGGRISVVRAVYYWVAQLLGSIVAALVLRLVTNNMVHYFLLQNNLYTSRMMYRAMLLQIFILRVT